MSDAAHPAQTPVAAAGIETQHLVAIAALGAEFTADDLDSVFPGFQQQIRFGALGCGEEGAAALPPDQQTFIHQFFDGLAHGHTAHTQLGSQFPFRRDRLFRLVFPGADALHQVVFDLQILLLHVGLPESS